MLLLLCCCWHTAYSADEAQVFPKSVTVEEGQGFLVNFPPVDKLKWDRCEVSIGTTKKVEKYSMSFTEHVTEFGIFKPYSDGTNCGLRVHQVTTKSNGDWVFKGVASGNNVYRQARAMINVLPKSVDKQMCPRKPDARQFCQWKNPINTTDTTTCGALPWTDYFCTFSRPGAMEMSEEDVRGKEDKVETTILGFTEVKTENGMQIMDCAFPKSIEGSLALCTITHGQSGKMYNIQNGLQHSRYSAGMTDFGRRICQFEIPNPVTADEEGVWTMEMKLEKTEIVHTCKYSLGSTEFVKAMTERAKTTIVLDTMKRMELINCVENAPFAIRRCFLQAPFDPKFLFNTEKDQMANGNCQFIVNLPVRHSGDKWSFSCGFSGPNPNDPDIIQPFTVRYFKNEVIDPKVDNVKKTLEFHQIDRLPIKSCIFVSKTNKIYSVPSDEFKSKEFDYFGPQNGFSEGACGIQFKDIDLEEGQWKCHINRLPDVAEPLDTEEGLLNY